MIGDKTWVMIESNQSFKIEHLKKLFTAAVLVAALGYFVDIYDLLLFSIVRVKSLTDLGLTGADLTDKGLLLINMQMAGMPIGGILFGILGDKKGRLSILFGSILLYSIANILNGFVQSYQAYAVLRFIAGVGLAGELGAGVSLVSESLPNEVRGLGTMVIASVGVGGAVLAWVIADLFAWRTTYFIGGGFGLLLPALRFGVSESGMFDKMTVAKNVAKGNFLSLFTSLDRFKRYMACILIGCQFWFMVGILINLSPEFAKALHVDGAIVATTVPNFVRGFLVPVSALFAYLKMQTGLLHSGMIVAAVCIAISFFGIYLYRDTYSKDLDYYEKA